ncbi:hypothetical protein LAD64_24255 [Klebsiella pneumoniae]|nr:hypothetical protein [Klebsiella pneumoniae]
MDIKHQKAFEAVKQALKGKMDFVVFHSALPVLISRPVRNPAHSCSTNSCLRLH